MYKEGGLNFVKILNGAIDFLKVIRKIKTIFTMFFIFLIAIFGVTLLFITFNILHRKCFRILCGFNFGPKKLLPIKNSVFNKEIMN